MNSCFIFVVQLMLLLLCFFQFCEYNKREEGLMIYYKGTVRLLRRTSFFERREGLKS